MSCFLLLPDMHLSHISSVVHSIPLPVLHFSSLWHVNYFCVNLEMLVLFLLNRSRSVILPRCVASRKDSMFLCDAMVNRKVNLSYLRYIDSETTVMWGWWMNWEWNANKRIAYASVTIWDVCCLTPSYQGLPQTVRISGLYSKSRKAHADRRVLILRDLMQS